MKLLIFSDIHGDLGALARLMDTEADYYVAAGDLVNFGRGLDRCGEILARRAGRVYVLPGNHETAAQTAALCRDFGLHDFHEQHAQWGRYQVAGLGYSNPTPFHTPGEYSGGTRAAGAHLPLPAAGYGARPDPPRLAWRVHGRARFSAAGTAGVFLLRAYPRGRRRARRYRQNAGDELGQAGLAVKAGVNAQPLRGAAPWAAAGSQPASRGGVGRRRSARRCPTGQSRKRSRRSGLPGETA